MKVGYARVSTGIQNLDLQLDAFREYMVSKKYLQIKLVDLKINEKD